jgi:polyhydroxyalkanoate synthase
MPPWINKYYILDLRQKNSFIKWAPTRATPSSSSPGSTRTSAREKGFDDYMTEGTARRARRHLLKQTGENEVNVIGYCLGGTLLGSTLGYIAAKKDKRIASATFFVCLLDFSIPGELGVFIDEQQVASLEKKMAERGYLEGSEMAGTFNMLRSNDLIWSFVVNNYLMGKEPFPFDLLYWNSDSTRMPYKMHSFYLRNMYMKNLLKEPGGIELNGVPIDISQGQGAGLLHLHHRGPHRAVEEHLPRRHALGGPVRFVLGGSGHIAGIVNPPAPTSTASGPTTRSRPARHADEWFEGAEQHPGSWWTDWQKWIGGLNGDDTSGCRRATRPRAS